VALADRHLRLHPAEAQDVAAWAIHALVEALKRDPLASTAGGRNRDGAAERADYDRSTFRPAGDRRHVLERPAELAVGPCIDNPRNGSSKGGNRECEFSP
jgi:hypothetical protein